MGRWLGLCPELPPYPGADPEPPEDEDTKVQEDEEIDRIGEAFCKDKADHVGPWWLEIENGHYHHEEEVLPCEGVLLGSVGAGLQALSPDRLEDEEVMAAAKEGNKGDEEVSAEVGIFGAHQEGQDEERGGVEPERENTSSCESEAGGPAVQGAEEEKIPGCRYLLRLTEGVQGHEAQADVGSQGQGRKRRKEGASGSPLSRAEMKPKTKRVRRSIRQRASRGRSQPLFR